MINPAVLALSAADLSESLDQLALFHFLPCQLGYGQAAARPPCRVA